MDIHVVNIYMGRRRREGTQVALIFFVMIPLLNQVVRELPGSPVVRTPCSHCQGPGFSPWSGN